MKKTAFWREKNGEYITCLKYSVPVFVEQIYKMKRLEVSGAVRPLEWSLGVKGLTLEPYRPAQACIATGLPIPMSAKCCNIKEPRYVHVLYIDIYVCV